MKILFPYIIILLAVGNVSGRSKLHLDPSQTVLRKEVVNRPFKFGRWNPDNGSTEETIIYLGKFKTFRGKEFKLLSYIWTWGLSGRATSKILIYDEKNKFVGYYYMNTESDLPDKLIGTKLVFINHDLHCDKSNKTVVDLWKGLPRQIIVKCRGNSGSVNMFNSN